MTTSEFTEEPKRELPAFLSRRMQKKATMKAIVETEGTSTTDTDGTDVDGSRHESDAHSDSTLEANGESERVESERVGLTALDINAGPEFGDDQPGTFDPMPGTCVDTPFHPYGDTPFSPDLFDLAPLRAPFAKSRAYNNNPEEVYPLPDARCAMAPRPEEAQGPQPQAWQPMQPPAMQPMAAPSPAQQQAMMQQAQQMAMQQMQQMGMAAPMQPMQMMQPMPAAPQQSASVVRVPVPVPMSMPFPMPNMMANFDPSKVAVPKGFKLVRIPEGKQEAASVPAPKPAPSDSSESAVSRPPICDPTQTERKIFVGGLNPLTTGQGLREYFSEFGVVADAKVIREGEKSKGFGFVQFRDAIPEAVLEGSHIIDQRRCGVGPAFHRA